MSQTCPTCRRPMLWVHGRQLCCNGQCPGTGQGQLDTPPAPQPLPTRKAPA